MPRSARATISSHKHYINNPVASILFFFFGRLKIYILLIRERVPVVPEKENTKHQGATLQKTAKQSKMSCSRGLFFFSNVIAFVGLYS